jgi:hypothetical protein
MLVDATEVLRGDNNGLQTIVGQLLPLPQKFNVSAGDVLHVSITSVLSSAHLFMLLFQLAGVLGVVRCTIS